MTSVTEERLKIENEKAKFRFKSSPIMMKGTFQEKNPTNHFLYNVMHRNEQYNTQNRGEINCNRVV